MISKSSIAAAVAVTTMLFAAPAGMAAGSAGLAPLKTLTAQSSIVEKTHGWHRKCRRGLNGFHKHVRGVGRIQCTTVRNCYYNIFGVKVCEHY